MERDIRNTETYQSVKRYYTSLYAPGEGHISDASDVNISPDGRYAVFTGDCYVSADQPAITLLCMLDIERQTLQHMDLAGASARLPCWSADGQRLAFLREDGPGNFQPMLSDASLNTPTALAPLPGIAEYLQWSPDGAQLLVGIAGYGADLAGCQGGATTVSDAEEALLSALPKVDTGDARNLWRDVYAIDVHTSSAKRLNPEGMNVWEACWLGPDRVAMVVSPSHSEGAWYSAKLIVFDLATHDYTIVFSPDDQIGVPAGSPSGRYIAFVEAFCSDRLIVCGTLTLVDTVTGDSRPIDTLGTEVTHVLWSDDDRLVFAGRRAFEVVIGDYSLASNSARDIWASADHICGSWYPKICGSPNGGVGAVIEGFNHPPQVARIHPNGTLETLWSSARPERAVDDTKYSIEEVRWTGRDGLEIHGWFVRPHGDGPFPVVMNIHGGPVWSVANRWQSKMLCAVPLADRGIATFWPNVRGSSARGQDYARKVRGDMGGEDTHDYLRGLDHLVAQGLADPERLGVTGISYGGFASCWLITQDDRFAAAVPISPVTNWYSQHWTSQIPHFDRLFLQDDPNKPGGKYFHRSPVMFAHRVKTPTLQLAGAVDQNTPPTQALEFHRALLEAGTESVLVTYPNAGHGIRNYPDVLDHITRSVDWFTSHFDAVADGKV